MERIPGLDGGDLSIHGIGRCLIDLPHRHIEEEKKRYKRKQAREVRNVWFVVMKRRRGGWRVTKPETSVGVASCHIIPAVTVCYRRD